MAEIHSISARHNDFAQGPDRPETVRIPRPLRDLLQASRLGLADAAGLAWNVASVAPGTWISVDPKLFAPGTAGARIKALMLRAQDAHLDLHMGFARGAHAAAIGRRVIVVAEPIPDTLSDAVIGRPLRDLVDGPFLDDASITIMKVIRRNGQPAVDVRCRCPSHLVALPQPTGDAR